MHSLVRKPLFRMRKLTKFMSDHILCDGDWIIISAIMDKEFYAGRVSFTRELENTHPTKFGRIVQLLAWVFMAT